MNLIQRSIKNPGLICKICNMEFSESERTLRHMMKAHTKPRRS